MKARLLVVDDEPSVRDMLSDALSMNDYEVLTATDGFAAVKLLRTERVDLIIADVNMPNMDGYAMLERLRANGDETAVLLLTARGERADVARGFRVGADDYVTKPFGLEELSLRIAAILKRTKGVAARVFECGPVSLNEDLHEVRVDGAVVDLSPTEFRLLYELISHQGRVVEKAQLLDKIWGMGFAPGATVVDTYISYLRKKVHTDAWQGIRTIRGVGFQMVG